MPNRQYIYKDGIQKRRSGVIGNFSVETILIHTKIRITADDATGFTPIYFNDDTDIDSKGFVFELPDVDVDVPVSSSVERYFISVNSSGNILTTTTKTDSGDQTRVHLCSYTALSGIAASAGLIANPYLVYSDKSFQGILNADGGRIDNLLITGADNATLGLISSDYQIVANSINYENDKISPHERPVNSQNPMVWAYYYRGITPLPDPGSSNLIDPTQWDDNGVLTPMPAGPNNSSVQLVIVSPKDDFVIIYGQEVFPTFDDALLNATLIDFNLPIELFEIAEVARIVTKRSATDSANQTEVFIIDTSRGGGGGSGIPPLTSEFFDGDFKLINSTDNTKTAQFEASKQVPSTNRIHKLPTENSELATLDLQETIAGIKTFPNNFLILADTTDPTKEAQFDNSNITPGQLNEYKFPNSAGELVVDLPTHSVTELSDVSDAGSGDIITTAERNQIVTNTSDILDKEDFTNGGQDNLGDTGTIDASSTKWYRISSTPTAPTTAVINSQFVVSIVEGNHNQSLRFSICLQNRDPTYQPSLTIISNHSFNTNDPIKAIRLVADAGSGTNDSFNVEIQVTNDSGAGNGSFKIHDRSLTDNQEAISFTVQPDTPVSPARVVKEWKVEALTFNVNDAFRMDNDDIIDYGPTQQMVPKITQNNLPFSFAVFQGIGSQWTRSNNANPALGQTLNDTTLNNTGLVGWTTVVNGSFDSENAVIGSTDIIDLAQSGENSFAFRLIKTGWYECECQFNLEGTNSNTNYTCYALRLNSSNVVIERLGVAEIFGEDRTSTTFIWKGYYNSGDAFCIVKTAGGVGNMIGKSQRFQIKWIGEV